MASGLLKAGVDLDSLLLARVSAKRADVGIKVAGVDVSNRYENIAGQPAGPDTGYKSGGVDLGALFLRFGTHALTAAYFDTGAGAEYRGFYLPQSVGSINPTTLLGSAINYLMDYDAAGVSDFFLNIAGAHPQNFFTSLLINGVTFTSASAIYSSTSVTEWRWSGIQAVLVPGNVYPLIFS